MKRPGKDRLLRRRIIAVFLIAVMLPSLIMAYLGLRYIKQEEQWQEQLIIKSFGVTLNNAALQIEQKIEQSVVHVFDSLVSQTALPLSVIPGQLHEFPAKYPFVKKLFILDTDGDLLFPRNFSSRRSTGEFQFNWLSPLLKQHLIQGEETEVRGNYADAIAKYKSGLNSCFSTRERLTFLIRIARCFYKAGNLNSSQQTYRRILDEDADKFFREELPYQFTASLQLAHIYTQTGENTKALEVLTQLYHKMVNQFHRFEQRRFEYFLDKVKTEFQVHIKHIGLTASALIDSLGKMKEVFLKEPVNYNFLQSNVIPLIDTAIRMNSIPNAVRHFLIEHSDSLTHIAFRKYGDKTQRIGIIGTVLSAKYLRQLVIETAKDTEVGENLRLVLLRNNINLLASDKTEATPIAEEPLQLLENTIQGYKLALVARQGMSIEEFASRGSLPYYILILTIIAVITLGVIFILHDISREQELTRMKSEFISNVTHEIKTPITTIRSLAENVNEGWVTSTNKQQDYFRLIACESERLGHLIENTLDYSRIESGNKNFQIRLNSSNEVIDKTVGRFHTLFQEQNVKINTELSPKLPLLRIDSEALELAILNLLDNAVKYSPGTKQIKLKAFVEKDNLVIAVSDQGIGVKQNDLTKIFRKFYRSESDFDKNITGSGIGLTIVKEIAEAHNGHVEVASEINKGSTFTIHIPIVRE